MKKLFYLLALTSTLVFSQQNHNRFKGSLVERYHRAKASQKYAPPGTPFTGRVYFKPPSDAYIYNKKTLRLEVEHSQIDENGIWWVKWTGQKHFAIIVTLYACNQAKNACYDYPQYIQHTWRDLMNSEMDITGGVWWDSDIYYKISDNRVKSNVYNKFSTMRNGQGKAILDTRVIRINHRAYDQLTNIAPDGRTMFGYANRKQDQNYEPYDSKGIFRLDKAMVGKVFPIRYEFKDDYGKVLGKGTVMVGIY